MAGIIVNIDEAIKHRSDFNVFREPLNALLQKTQEQWEQDNPIDLFFTNATIDKFQEHFESSIGFDHAFVETNDFARGPIFNNAEGFSATYRTRTFQGGFIVTQQAIEDGDAAGISNMAEQFVNRWNGEKVEYCMAAIEAGFGKTIVWGDEFDDPHEGKSYLKLTSADTPDGDIHNEVHNPLFYKKHTIVKRDTMTDEDITKMYQSNIFYADVDYKGSSPDRISALADVIYQVITIMENYRDDNGKYAGVRGTKTIVAANDPHLKAALNTALSTDMFCMGNLQQLNPAYQMATAAFTSYLNDNPSCKDGSGFFILDKAYMAANHGLELTSRIPFNFRASELVNPDGIFYNGRERFDVNCASWRGIAYVRLSDVSDTESDWNYKDKFTEITPIATIVKPVAVVSMPG